MAKTDYVFTSESVSEGHPDKVSDRISDAIVDLYLKADPYARVALETLCTTNRIVLAGEVRGPASGKYRRTRLFVLTLGYSRKCARLVTFKSSTRSRWSCTKRRFAV